MQRHSCPPERAPSATTPAQPFTGIQPESLLPPCPPAFFLITSWRHVVTLRARLGMQVCFALYVCALKLQSVQFVCNGILLSVECVVRRAGPLNVECVVCGPARPRSRPPSPILARARMASVERAHRCKACTPYSRLPCKSHKGTS